jgi:hypothetical protein
MQRIIRMVGVACALAAALVAGNAAAVQFTGSQTAPGEWTYTLTYNPNDNYSICQPNTTITLSGLAGVTQALAPTSTDYTDSLATTNLAWTPQVLNGGTTVVWTHAGPGTGNYPTDMHVYGFKVLAPSASDGTVHVATSGFALDGSCPTTVLDISTSVSGPAIATAEAVPALGPPALVAFALLVALAGAVALRALL